ncbi:MAG: UvrB/UvrC motif-containing protein [Thermoguttaceae bacterium]
MSDRTINRKNHWEQLVSDLPSIQSESTTRLIRSSDGHYVLQMRVNLGLLQMEVTGRPDGQRPYHFATYFAYLVHFVKKRNSRFLLTEQQYEDVCCEVEQFDVRSQCWFSLNRYQRAIRDADHAIDLLNLIRRWTIPSARTQELEERRLLILTHRIQAGIAFALYEKGPNEAIATLEKGMEYLRQQIEEGDSGELARVLARFLDTKHWFQQYYCIRSNDLEEQLEEAIRQEQYERAARIRDTLRTGG